MSSRTRHGLSQELIFLDDKLYAISVLLVFETVNSFQVVSKEKPGRVRSAVTLSKISY